MSYILDALRKADQQRQRGLAPALSSAPIPTSWETPPGKSARVLIGLTSLALLGLGVTIGWLHPWSDAERLASRQPPDLPSSTGVAPTALAQSTPVPSVLSSSVPPTAARSGGERATSGTSSASAPAIKSVPPPSARRDLPKITMTVHAYSPEPSERRAVINRQALREGEEVAPGLKLESITADGVILSYKGQRFHRGLH